MSKEVSKDDLSKVITVIDDFTLFEPSDSKYSDMRQDFPEIAEDPAFNGLSARVLRFIWYVSNRTSPIIHERNHSERVKNAVTTVWGNQWKNNSEATKLYNGEFTPAIRGAMERMVQFNPSKRLRARMMAEYAFDQANIAIMASRSEIDQMDFDERKRYMQILIDIIQKLPELLDAIEKGYGIKIKKTKEVVRSQVTAGDIHNELGND